MSLVATYVRATDGWFYSDPVVDSKDYFICFDDDDPPELVVIKEANLDPKKILSDLGIKFSHVRYHEECGRIFDDKIVNAVSYFFRLEGRFPVEIITAHDGRKRSKDIVQGVIYDYPEK